MRNFLNFFTQTFPCACRVCVAISVANGQKTWPPNANMHTHTHTDRQLELYILDIGSMARPSYGQDTVV